MNEIGYLCQIKGFESLVEGFGILFYFKGCPEFDLDF